MTLHNGPARGRCFFVAFDFVDTVCVTPFAARAGMTNALFQIPGNSREPVVECSAELDRAQKESVAESVREAESLVAQGLIAINQGLKLEAMEDLYAASCVLERLRSVLETPTDCAENQSAMRS